MSGQYDDKLDELLSQIKDFAEGTFKYRGKITTNAKGEASFEVRIATNEGIDTIEIKAKLVLESLMRICVDNEIPIAGR